MNSVCTSMSHVTPNTGYQSISHAFTYTEAFTYGCTETHFKASIQCYINIKKENGRNEKREKIAVYRQTEQRWSWGSMCCVSIHHSGCYVALSCLAAVSLHPQCLLPLTAHTINHTHAHIQPHIGMLNKIFFKSSQRQKTTPQYLLLNTGAGWVCCPNIWSCVPLGEWVGTVRLNLNECVDLRCPRVSDSPQCPSLQPCSVLRSLLWNTHPGMNQNQISFILTYLSWGWNWIKNWTQKHRGVKVKICTLHRNR